MRAIREAVGAYAAGFDAALVTAADAQRIVEDAIAAENMLATVRGLAAERVSKTELWRKEGDRSPAHQLARKSGTSVGKAREALETAGLEEVAEIFAIVQGWANERFKKARAEGRYETGEAYLADGLLDAMRASQVPGTGGSDGSAATATGSAQPRGGPAAGGGSGGGEPRSGGRGGANPSGGTGPCGTSTDDGPAEPGGAAPGTRADPPAEVFADDAATATPVAPSPPGPAATSPGSPAPARPPNPAKVIVRIDWDALLRGWPIDGEVSEIAGLGPIAVSAVRAMIASGNGFLAAVVTKGVDVVNVAHLGRNATAYQQTALEWLSPSCTTLGCNATVRLENDHRVPWAESKVTLLSNLDRRCSHCHDLTTYQGWAYVEGRGKRPLVPPDDPRHPRHQEQAPAPRDAGGLP